MKPSHQSGNDAQLNEAMRQWTVETPLPPRFAEQVWRRIAQAEVKTQPRITVFSWLRRLVETSLPRPQFAYSYVAILLLLGIVSGAWAAQRQTTRLDAAMGSRYVQAVDPYQKSALNP